MLSSAFHRLFTFPLAVVLGLAVLGTVAPPDAQARQVTVSAEFRTALDPHGSWKQHKRWGEVWIPSDRPRDWRPYTVGKWVYTNEYGWYWRAADREAAWGEIVYHYGRWVLDPDFGWVWIPGDVWGPAWVSWRRGEPREGRHRHVVGWAPLPPDEVVVEIRDEPRYWVFVPARAVAAADIIVNVVLPPQPVLLQTTVIVDRTVIVRKGGATFAVSSGIQPDYVAFAYGRPIASYSLRPRVLAGTMAPPDAVTIRAEQLRGTRRGRDGARLAGELQQSRQIQPSRSIEPPQALSEGGAIKSENLPRAARGAEVVSTPAQASQSRSRPDAGAAQQQGAGQAPEGTKQDQAQQPRGAEPGTAERSQKDAAKEKDGRQPQKDAEKDKGSRPQKDAEQDVSRQPRKDTSDGRQRSQQREADKDADRGTKGAREDSGRRPQQDAGQSRQKEEADERKSQQRSGADRGSRPQKEAVPQREPERQKAGERDAGNARGAESQPARPSREGPPATVGRSPPGGPPEAGGPKGEKAK